MSTSYRRVSSLVVGFFLAASLLMRCHVALAAEAVVVGNFTGAKAKAVREHVQKALEGGGYTVSSDEKVGRARGKDARAYAAAARAHQATAVVTGKVGMKKSGYTLDLVVRSGQDGSVLDEPKIQGATFPAFLKNVDTKTTDVVADAIEKGAASSAPPAETAPVAAEEPAAPANTKEKGKGKSAPSAASAQPEEEPEERPAEHEAPRGPARYPVAFEAMAGVQAFSRHFSYHQDVNENLRPYSLSLAPAAFVGLGWYPGAHFSSGAIAHLGLVADYAQSVATTSTLEAGGPSHSTQLRTFSVGVRGRIPLGTHELGLSLRAGRHDFTISGDANPNGTVASGASVSRDLVPDVRYEYLRPGLDMRLVFGPVAVGAYVGYRAVLDAGDVQKDVWFPRATVVAGDAGLFGGYALGSGFEVQAGVDLRRYAFNMHSKPADVTSKDVAGGAIDQYATAWLGLRWAAGRH